MRKKEQRLWDNMRKHLAPWFWLTRIENVVAEGMPDVLIISEGRHRWVELKAVRLPRQPTTRLLGTEGLRPSQINWHLKAQRNGVHSYVLIRDDIGQLYLLPGELADVMNELTLEEVAHHCLIAGHNRASDWEVIREILG